MAETAQHTDTNNKERLKSTKETNRRILKQLIRESGYNEFLFVMTRRPHSDLGCLIAEFLWLHSDTPQSVGLLWTSGRPVAETSTWQHSTLTTDIPAPGGIRTRNPGRLTSADPRLRPHGHCSEQMIISNMTKIETFSFLNTSNSATGCGSFRHLLH